MDHTTKAELLFIENDYWWMHPFAFHLNQISPPLAVHWAIRCLRKLAAFRFNNRFVEFRDDIEVAEQYLVCFPGLDDAKAMEGDVWYRPPHRDQVQTAVSKLFSAIICLQDKEDGFVLTCCSVVSNLVRDDWPTDKRCSSKPIYDLVHECYNQVLSDSGQDVG